MDSIVNQTYRELKILLVDDGSSESSSEICDEYTKKDSRIIVVHQENKGLSAARNVGIMMATSPYATFVDSDDYIDVDTYEVSWQGIQKYSPDLLFFREKTVDLNGKTIYINGDEPTGEILVKDRQFAEERIIGQLINGMCDKIYRTEILKSIDFEVGRQHGEDFLYNLLALKQVDTVVYVDQIKYSYVTNPESITRSRFSSAAFDQLYFKDEVARIVGESFPSYKKLCQKRAFLARLRLMRPLFSEHLEKQYKNEIRSFRDYLKLHRGEHSLSTVEAVEYWSFIHFMPIYRLFLFAVSFRKH